MSTATLAVGVSIAGLFVMIVVGVIVAFCIYQYKYPTTEMTRVKEIKKDTSRIKKRTNNIKREKNRNKDGATKTRLPAGFRFCSCTCCCIERDEASSDEGEVTKTAEAIVMPDEQITPQTPEDIVLENPSATEVTIKWRISDQDYVERFQIFKRLAKKSSVWIKVKSLKKPIARSFRIKKLDSDVRYVFGVAAKNAAGKSSIAESVPIVLKHNPVVENHPTTREIGDLLRLRSTPTGNTANFYMSNSLIYIPEIHRQIFKHSVSEEDIMKILPGPPSELVTWQKSKTTLTLSWKPPKFDGHLRIIRYHIWIRNENMEWRPLAALQAFDRFMDYRVSGLTQNIPYRFRVTAENDVGIGPHIETRDVLLHDGPVPPDKPKGPLRYYDITHNALTVSWQEPEQDGGQPISGYAVDVLDARQEKWRKVGVVSKGNTSFRINKLSEGCHYFARVVAISNVGNSQPLTGTKFRTKILEIPLSQRSSSRMNNYSRVQSRGISGTRRSMTATPWTGQRSLNDSGNLSEDFNEHEFQAGRSGAKRSRSGKIRNAINRYGNGTGNDDMTYRNSKNGDGFNVATVDVGIKTISGGVQTVDIGVETERDWTETTDIEDVSTDVSSLYENYGKFRNLRNTLKSQANPSNVAYAFR